MSIVHEDFVVGGGSLGGSGWWAGWCSYPVCIRGDHGLEFPQDHPRPDLGWEAVRVRGQSCVLILGRGQRSACQVSAPPTTHDSSPLAGPTARLVLPDGHNSQPKTLSSFWPLCPSLGPRQGRAGSREVTHGKRKNRK